MNTKEWDILFEKVQKEIHELYKKNRVDYIKTDDNPMSSLVRSLNINIEPHIANLIRLGDKFNLIENFIKNNKYYTHDENIRETLLDIASYTVLTILLLDQGNKNE